MVGCSRGSHPEWRPLNKSIHLVFLYIILSLRHSVSLVLIRGKTGRYFILVGFFLRYLYGRLFFFHSFDIRHTRADAIVAIEVRYFFK